MSSRTYVSNRTRRRSPRRGKSVAFQKVLGCCGGKGIAGEKLARPGNQLLAVLQAVAIAPGPAAEYRDQRLGRLGHNLRCIAPAGRRFEAFDAILVKHLVDEQLDIRQ